MLSGLSFKGHGDFPAPCWVSAARVIEAVDLLEDCGLGLPTGFQSVSPDQFGLDRF